MNIYNCSSEDFKFNLSNEPVRMVSYSRMNHSSGCKILFFQSEEEMTNCQLSEDNKDILGFVLPDENTMVFMQNKFPHINMEIGSPASFLDVDQIPFQNYEKIYDIACIVNKKSLDDYYQIISKLTYLKWLILCEDNVSYNFFGALNIKNLIVTRYTTDDQQILSSKCFLSFPEYHKFPHKIIGYLLLENIPLIIIQNENFYDGHRNISYWDNIVVSATSIMTTRFLSHERIAWFLEMYNNGKNWLKPREYYKQFLGLKSIKILFEQAI